MFNWGKWNENMKVALNTYFAQITVFVNDEIKYLKYILFS